ncbi:MAG: lysylphosphatidylglycerol synthase domain-containing protein, partial [Chloroflexota bacterium]
MRKYLSNILKLLVTMIALWLVLREVDLQEIWQTILSANLWWVFAGFMLFNVSMVVRAMRWWVLLRGLGNAPKF